MMTFIFDCLFALKSFNPEIRVSKTSRPKNNIISIFGLKCYNTKCRDIRSLWIQKIDRNILSCTHLYNEPDI